MIVHFFQEGGSVLLYSHQKHNRSSGNTASQKYRNRFRSSYSAVRAKWPVQVSYRSASQPTAYGQPRQRGNVQPTSPARPIAVESAMFMTGQPPPFQQNRPDRVEHRAERMNQPHQSYNVDHGMQHGSEPNRRNHETPNRRQYEPYTGNGGNPPFSAGTSDSTLQTQGHSYSYIDEIRVTLVELDKAVKNIQMMAGMAKSLGLSSLLSSSGSNSSSQTGLLGLLKSIDMKQVRALMNSPALRKIVTDPEFFQLFAPDTGTTPGTKVEPPGEERTSNSN
jgi:hypothetical protein